MRRLALVLLSALGLAAVAAPPTPFSAAAPGGALPGAWETVDLVKGAGATDFALVEDGGAVVLRAESRDAATGLGHPVEVDLAEQPILAWRWKVETPVPDANLRRKKGDDAAARLYVTFDLPLGELSFRQRLVFRGLRLLGYDALPTRALCYVWSNEVPDGTLLPNAYSDLVQMIVLRDAGDAGRWHTEQRDVAADYRRAFGEAPVPVNGIALLTDTDDTGGAAVAYYGDVTFAEE